MRWALLGTLIGTCLGCGDSTSASDRTAEMDTGRNDAMVSPEMGPITDASRGSADVSVAPPADARVSMMDADSAPLADAAVEPSDDAMAPVLDASSAVPDAGPVAVDAAPIAPDAAVDPCADSIACLDFEGAALGAPQIAGWEVVTPNCSGEGRITIEDDRPHRGERVMHVTGPGGYCNHVFLGLQTPLNLAGDPVYVRFYMRVARPLGFGHITFLTMHDAQTDRALRMGGQSEILMWNREIDDATLPELSPTGIDLSFAPVSNQWHCIEFMVDGPAGALQTWVDGGGVPGLVVDADPTHDIDGQWHRRPDWRPVLENIRIGWESYGGDAADVWFDDIAIATTPIGCLP